VFYPDMDARRLEPGHSVVSVPVGELSLSGEPECLSLHSSILFERSETGKILVCGRLSFLPPRERRRASRKDF
jgi:hypothetical protein